MHPILNDVIARIGAAEAYADEKSLLAPELADAWMSADDETKRTMLAQMYPHAVQRWARVARLQLAGYRTRTLPGDSTPKIRTRGTPRYSKMLVVAFDVLNECDHHQLSEAFRWNSPRVMRELIESFDSRHFPLRITHGSRESA